MINWLMSTHERVNAGIFMPYGLLDASAQLVTKVDSEGPSLSYRLLQFLRPFDWTVWCAFIVLCAATGLLYWYLERGQNPDDLLEDRGSREGIVNSTFLASLQVAGGGGYTPVTWPGKILVFSWAWTVLLFVSSYTANLASFLVVEHKAGVPVEDLTEAMARDMSICVTKGTAVWDHVRRANPSYPKFVPVDDSAILGLATGHCDAALSSRFRFDFAKQSEELNPHCDLTPVGEPVVSLHAGWAVYNDYVQKCTVLVSQVLNVIFHDLDEEGVLDAIYAGLVKKKETRLKSCSKAKRSPSLNLVSMAGILSTHVILSAVALCTLCVSRSRSKAASEGEDAREGSA